MMPCGFVCVPKVQSTTSQNPASMAMTAVCIMPTAVAPPMSMVAQNDGTMPRNAATREAQPCCSPICAGIRQSTPSTSSRATPQSSMARFAASRQKPIALTPGTLPKRDRPMPATAWRLRSRAGSRTDRYRLCQTSGSPRWAFPHGPPAMDIDDVTRGSYVEPRPLMSRTDDDVPLSARAPRIVQGSPDAIIRGAAAWATPSGVPGEPARISRRFTAASRNPGRGRDVRGRRLHHASQRGVGDRPGLLRFSAQRIAQSGAQRAEERSAGGVVVLVLDAVAGVTAAEVLHGGHELVEPIEARHDRAQDGHQPPALLGHVAPEEQLRD